jgi:iron complex transport system substrate-binding protein
VRPGCLQAVLPTYFAWAPICLALMLLAGCERPSGTTTSQPTARLAGDSSKTGLRDWVLNPPLVEGESQAACPRLLSAAPNVTEICCALGLADHLVGRTRYCNYPPSIQSVPSIGALNDLNVEVLLEIKPDLILVSGASRAIADRLSRLGLPFESVPDVTLEDLFTAIERIGELTGRRQTARLLVDGLHADLDRVAARFTDGPKAWVLIVTEPLPDPPTQPTAAGPGSFYDDLLRRVGHTNAARPGGRPFAPLSLEFILAADPEVIIELAPDQAIRPGGDADARRVWAQVGPLKAVASGRVHVLVGTQHSLLGPRIARTFEALCRAIAGERYE